MNAKQIRKRIERLQLVRLQYKEVIKDLTNARDTLWEAVADNEIETRRLFDELSDLEAVKLHYCCVPDCPGFPYKASEIAHPCNSEESSNYIDKKYDA